MVIIHIAKLRNRIFCGVDMVVPQHVIMQQEYADVCLINLFDTDVQGIKHYFKYCNIKIDELPAPYDKPDLVVFHEAYNIENIEIYRSLLEKKIPYVIVPHGELSLEAQRKKWIKKKIGNLILFKRFIKHAVAIQCLSKREADSTCFSVPKFIGTNGIYLPEKYKTNFNNDGLKFVYIGRLDVYHKGLDLLIGAITHVKDILREKNCSFYIYGPSNREQREKLEKMVSENEVTDLVYLKNAVSGEEKQRVLLDTDIFIQTSRFEGMPMGILEALSYGIPCLVTEGTTLKNMVEKYNAGWGADTNVNSICMILHQVINGNYDLMSLSKNARELSSRNFSWSNIAKSTIETYRNLIDKER